jgi:glycosyltransferase involved in cell wall biosynthesis
MYEKIFSLVNEYKLESDIVFTDYVSREDLNALYKMAEVFGYPSFYEGVGLPVLEAFNFGLPVVASRASSVGEIAADAAVLIDPYKPEEIVQAILTIFGDDKFKQDLIKKGFQRAKEFSWDEAARKTVGVFNEFA